MTAAVFRTRSRTALLGVEPIDALAYAANPGRPLPAPLGPLQFEVPRERRGGVARDFAEPLEMAMRRSPSGIHVFTGLVRAAGSPGARALPGGEYAVRVSSPFYRTHESQWVRIPPDDPADALVRIELQPSYAYPFPVGRAIPGNPATALLRGSLHRRGGEGIEDARVSATLPRFDQLGNPLPNQFWEGEYRTDHSGQWVLALPADVFANGAAVDVMVHLAYPGGSDAEAGVTIARGEQARLAETSLTGRVERAGGGGAAGATVMVAGFSGEAVTDGNGDWSWFFQFDDTLPGLAVVTAALPHGRSLSAAVVIAEGERHRVPPFVFD